MKLTKSLLLASVAGFAAVASAQAADLPSKKAAPVEYVKVCPTYGPGFFFIPGTTDCLKIGGRVRAQMGFAQTYSRGDDVTGFRAQLRPEFDHRSSTEYGLLRTHVRLEIARRTGEQTGNDRNSEGLTLMNARRGANGSTLFSVDRAYVQLGGLTAGRSVSFFDNTGDVVRFDSMGHSDRVTNLFAYTASLGGGFTATISAEDNNERKNNQAPTAAFQNADGFRVASGNNSYNGGNAVPDGVLQLRLVQSWGNIQASGALHEVRANWWAGAVDAGTNSPAIAANSGRFADTEFGHALSLGGRINLPMIAAGDYFHLSGTYAKGALDYVNPINAGGNWSVTQNDVASVVDANGNLTSKLTTSMGLAAVFHHQFTPTVFSRVYGAYTKFEVPSAIRDVAVNGVYASQTGNNATAMNAGFQVGWNPVVNLTLITQIDYTKFDPSGQVRAANPTFAGANAAKGSVDTWTGRIRIQRDF